MYNTEYLLAPFYPNYYDNYLGLNKIDLNVLNIIDIFYLFVFLFIISFFMYISTSREVHNYQLIPTIDLDDDDEEDSNNNINLNEYTDFAREEYF